MKLQELGGGCEPRTELVTTQQLLDQCAKFEPLEVKGSWWD